MATSKNESCFFKDTRLITITTAAITTYWHPAFSAVMFTAAKLWTSCK